MLTFENFPARRLDTARQVLADAHEKICKAAKRAGQPAPAAPELVIADQRSVVRCSGPKMHAPDPRRGEPKLGEDCPVLECCGVITTYTYLTLELHAERPKLAGWDFLAVVEPLNGEALIRQVPGAAIPEGFTFDAWRSGSLACDHCGTVRNRSETFLVRSNGDDAAVPAGSVKQVGRQCLAAFLGSGSISAIIASLAWERLISACGGEGDEESGGGWGGSRDTSQHALRFLVQACAIVRQDGYVSRRDVEANPSRQTTGSATLYAMTPPGFSFAARREWQKFHEDHPVEAQDKERAAAVLEWTRALKPTGEYERNLELVARGERVEAKHAGILASAISAWERAVGREVERKRLASIDRTASAHVGAEKDRLETVVTVERVAGVETDYGTLHIHTFRDAAGNALVWKTTSVRLDIGWTGPIRATVKRHSEYKGEKQTEVSRVDTDPQPKAPRKRAPKKAKPEGATAHPPIHPAAVMEST